VGRPRKSLEELVRDGSFRARRQGHADFLESSPDLPWKGPRALQKRYRRAKRAETRRRIAVEFERLVEELADEGATAPDRPLADVLAELGEPGTAEFYINFFPRFFRHTKGPLAGARFELEDWQQDFMREAHRRDEAGRRVYQRIYLIVPGGNGKTPVAAGHAVADLTWLKDEPEIYCIAGAKGQAGRPLEFARSFVDGTDEYPGELKQWLRTAGAKIRNPETGGFMEVLPASGALLEGKGPSVAIVDEPHALERDVHERSYVAMSGKLHKRENAYLFGISTAGRGQKSVLWRIIKAARGWPIVELRGYLTVCKDEEHGQLLWMYSAPADAPLEDLDVIRGVNPASWLDPRDIVSQLHDAGVGEAEYRRLARNEWSAVKSQWLPPGKWEALADPDRGMPPAGTDVTLGFDGSYNNDATALVGWTRDDYGFVIDVWERPEDDPNWIVPRSEVKATVEWAMNHFNVLELVCDPPGWHEDVERWAELYGEVVTVQFLTNEIKLMSLACREFFAAVVNSATLRHDGDARLARHLANAFVRETRDGAYITKEYRDSANKIDAAVAAVVARYVMLRQRAKERERRSVYEERGLLAVGLDDEHEEMDEDAISERLSREQLAELGLVSDDEGDDD